MGLDASVVKPLEYLGMNLPEHDDWTYISTMKFGQIKHLTEFKTGFYKAEEYDKPHFNMSYGNFTHVFRENICRNMYQKGYEETCKDVEDGKIAWDAPFVEMLEFADNEGCYDYVIAEKLLNDFEMYRDKIVPNLIGYLPQCYDTYTELLKKCVEVKGVVYYA